MGMLLRRYHKQPEPAAAPVNLADKTVKELRVMAKDKGVEGYSTLDKDALTKALEG